MPRKISPSGEPGGSRCALVWSGSGEGSAIEGVAPLRGRLGEGGVEVAAGLGSALGLGCEALDATPCRCLSRCLIRCLSRLP